MFMFNYVVAVNIVAILHCCIKLLMMLLLNYVVAIDVECEMLLNYVVIVEVECDLIIFFRFSYCFQIQ